MDLVTDAFFEGDFSEVSLLKDAFHHLNGCLPLSYVQHLHDGKILLHLHTMSLVNRTCI